MERRLLTGTRRFALLAMVALLAGGLVWGLATAFAAGSSPSPRTTQMWKFLNRKR